MPRDVSRGRARIRAPRRRARGTADWLVPPESTSPTSGPRAGLAEADSTTTDPWVGSDHTHAGRSPRRPLNRWTTAELDRTPAPSRTRPPMDPAPTRTCPPPHTGPPPMDPPPHTTSESASAGEGPGAGRAGGAGRGGGPPARAPHGLGAPSSPVAQQRQAALPGPVGDPGHGEPLQGEQRLRGTVGPRGPFCSHRADAPRLAVPRVSEKETVLELSGNQGGEGR